MLRTLSLVFLLSGSAAAQVSFQTVSAKTTASLDSELRTNLVGGPVSISKTYWNGDSGMAQASTTNSGETVSVNASATSTLSSPYVNTFWGPVLALGVIAEAKAEMVVRLSSPFPTAGYLTLSGSPPLFKTSIDIGNDGSEEPFGSFIPIVVDEIGIEIALSTKVSAIDPFNEEDSGSAEVTFNAFPTYLDTALIACGASLGAWIEPTSPNGTLRLDLQSTVLTPHTFLVFGRTPQTMPFPFPSLSCATLGLDVLVSVPIPTDSMARATAVFPLPSGSGQPVYLQFLVGTLDASGDPVWRASNRLEVRL